MSYDIYIGNAEIESEVREDEFYVRWIVNGHSEPDAPNFEGDTLTQNTNSRHPGYSQWANFLKEVGLYDTFFNEEIGLMREHPGCFPLTRQHLVKFKDALEYLNMTDKRPAGLDPRLIKDDFIQIPQGEETHSYNKVRLIWLIYWTEWALRNCQYPAIYNY